MITVVAKQGEGYVDEGMECEFTQIPLLEITQESPVIVWCDEAYWID